MAPRLLRLVLAAAACALCEAGRRGKQAVPPPPPPPPSMVETVLAAPLQYGLLALAAVLVLFALTGPPRGSPPMASVGLPFIGNFIEFGKNPIAFILMGVEKFGNVFTVKMFGKRLTFLIGPEPAKQFFASKDDTMSQPEVYGFMTAVFGKGVVYDATPKIRRQQMQHMTTGLISDALRSYVTKIEAETNAFLAKWPDDGEVDLIKDLGEMIILTASRCLHGDDVRETMFADVARLYHDLDLGITPTSFFWPNAPTANHRTRDKARIEISALFSKVIQARRAKEKAGTLVKGDDILQVFMDMVYTDGSVPTDDEITGLLIALLFAGQHTSSVTSAWVLLHLAEHADVRARVLAEGKAATKGAAAFSFDHIEQMSLLHVCMKEVLRLFPPLIMLMRKCKKPVEVQNRNGDSYTVPAGDIVFASSAASHRLETTFPDAEKFDPDRFLPPRSEDKRPYAFQGFGGGMHACKGQQFGYLQVKTIVSIVLRDFEIAPCGPIPGPDYASMVVGPLGAPKIRVKRIKKK